MGGPAGLRSQFPNHALGPELHSARNPGGITRVYLIMINYLLVIEHSHGIDGPFIDGLPIKSVDFPWLC
jgi:hypothetical protein